MRQRDQSIAVIIDEHGSVAGIATMEDLVEEIVGESGTDGTHPKLEMVREGLSALVMRGSTAIADVEEMLGVHFGEDADEAVTTIAGLLSHVSGKVPAPGEKCDLEGYRFEVLEANQRKVLRVKVQKLSSTAIPANQQP
jgi:magnesium and cobalt transporter